MLIKEILARDITTTIDPILKLISKKKRITETNIKTNVRARIRFFLYSKYDYHFMNANHFLPFKSRYLASKSLFDEDGDEVLYLF